MYTGPEMLDRFADWWMSGRRYDVFLGLLLASICTLVFVVGVPRLVMYGHDVFVSLDGAWRVLNGQRPQVDFFAQMGPAYYLIHAAGLELARGDAGGLGYGSTMVAVALASWSFLLLRSRMASIPFCLACVMLVLLASAPFPLGMEPWYTSFSMKHNRYGFALTGLIFLECFLPPAAGEGRRKQLGGAFSSGVACALLLFLKISYGMVALVLMAVSIVVRPAKRIRLAGLIGGLLSFGLPMLAYLRFNLPALAREYEVLAATQSQRFTIPTIVWRVYLGRFEILPVLLLAMLTALLPSVSRRRAMVLMVAAVLATGGGVLLIVGNTQAGDYPLMAALAILLVNELTTVLAQGARIQTATLLVFGLLAMAVPTALDGGGLALALWSKLHPSGPDYSFHAAHLRALRFADVDNVYLHNDNGQPFVRYTEEGMDLVRACGRSGESVRGLGMSNPFSFALLRRPPLGGAVALAATNSSAASIPPKEMLIGDADLLLVPRYPASERETLALVLARYPELLVREYRRVASSRHWDLYRRAR